jgi:hypothetical protein
LYGIDRGLIYITAPGSGQNRQLANGTTTTNGKGDYNLGRLISRGWQPLTFNLTLQISQVRSQVYILAGIGSISRTGSIVLARSA